MWMDEAVSGDGSETNRLKREGLTSVVILFYFSMRRVEKGDWVLRRRVVLEWLSRLVEHYVSNLLSLWFDIIKKNIALN
jgi:hypothetical protein